MTVTTTATATATATSTAAATATTRRTELAAFLRSRRERIRPEDVGLPPGTRRRTTGLRREELAQLAGVGVTWYTWLEQGRPINASVQVLEAIARTLKLDSVERTHLFRLADVPGVVPAGECDIPLPEAIQEVMNAMDVPACVVTDRFDLLAWNDMYATIFPRVTSLPAEDRNTLLSIFTAASCCTPLADQNAYCQAMVGQLRVAYARHVGDAAWTHFIRRLEAESPKFAAAWAAHDVAQPGTFSKALRHPGVGEFTLISTSFAVHTVPGARMTVYTPADEDSRTALKRLAAGEGRDARFPCWPAHSPERTVVTARPSDQLATGVVR
ncbi:MAG TPA: helix-turn-helix transcriptional regulator [Trebonia sp.]|jgi:transcriptional regulator with XRE-family HTH domain|nr:helix-turn-helix transcriptional regulator [Trebonia sp.]